MKAGEEAMKSLVFRAAIGSLALLGLLSSASLSAVAAPASRPDYAAIDSYVSSSLAGTRLRRQHRSR